MTPARTKPTSKQNLSMAKKQMGKFPFIRGRAIPVGLAKLNAPYAPFHPDDSTESSPNNFGPLVQMVAVMQQILKIQILSESSRYKNRDSAYITF